MKDLLFSERLLQELSDDELASVCAHEAAVKVAEPAVYARALENIYQINQMLARKTFSRLSKADNRPICALH